MDAKLAVDVIGGVFHSLFVSLAILLGIVVVLVLVVVGLICYIVFSGESSNGPTPEKTQVVGENLSVTPT